MKKFLVTTGLTLLLFNVAQQAWSEGTDVKENVAEVTLAEQRLSRELAAAVSDGRVVNLGEGQQAFLGIFLESQTQKSRGGIILLHDLNNHADWPEVIAPLRRRLTRYGWNTLSIQLPPPPTMTAPIPQSTDESSVTKLEQEIDRRVQAAIEYCRSQRIFNIVLLGHQFGAIMASRYLANKASQDNSISALVAVNLYSPALDSEELPDLDTLSKIHGAFLELIPDRIPRYARELAEKRQTVMTRLGRDRYKQIHVMGADYTFSGAEFTLASRIQGWLAKLAPSVEVQMAAPQGAANASTTQTENDANNQPK